MGLKERAIFYLVGKNKGGHCRDYCYAPNYLVLDEPTAMNPSGREEVMNNIQMLNKEEGLTIIHITHFMGNGIGRSSSYYGQGRLFWRVPQRMFLSNKDLENCLDVPQVTE